jgi:hypothetical protein
MSLATCTGVPVPMGIFSRRNPIGLVECHGGFLASPAWPPRCRHLKAAVTRSHETRGFPVVSSRTRREENRGR